MVAALYGRRPEMVLGDTSDLEPKQIAQAMTAEGYVPWDPRSIMQRSKTQAEAGQPGVLWLPEHIKRAVDNYYGKAGGLERFMRRYYDKPVTWWKAAVLALRPAWHVNNVLSERADGDGRLRDGPPDHLRQEDAPVVRAAQAARRAARRRAARGRRAYRPDVRAAHGERDVTRASRRVAVDREEHHRGPARSRRSAARAKRRRRSGSWKARPARRCCSRRTCARPSRC